MRKPVGKRLLPPATVGALPLDSTSWLRPTRLSSTLHPTQAQDDAVAALCRQLNRSATLYPGTSLRLVYEILPPQPPT